MTSCIHGSIKTIGLRLYRDQPAVVCCSMADKHHHYEEADVGPRESLLALVLAKADQDKASHCSRVVLTARLGHDINEIALKGAFTQAVQKHWSREAAVTGILLAYPSCLVCLLEGPSHALLQLLQDLAIDPELAPTMKESRVLLSSEGLPQRCCTTWHAAFVPSGSGAHSSDAVEPDKLAKVAAACCATLRQLVGELAALQEGELRRHLQSLATYHPDLPSCDALLALLDSDRLPSLEQWQAFNSRPASAVLAADLVWPLPKPLLV